VVFALFGGEVGGGKDENVLVIIGVGVVTVSSSVVGVANLEHEVMIIDTAAEKVRINNGNLPFISICF
jgi:UDP-glucose 6-dehydrogenase